MLNNVELGAANLGCALRLGLETITHLSKHQTLANQRDVVSLLSLNRYAMNSFIHRVCSAASLVYDSLSLDRWHG